MVSKDSTLHRSGSGLFGGAGLGPAPGARGARSAKGEALSLEDAPEPGEAPAPSGAGEPLARGAVEEAEARYGAPVKDYWRGRMLRKKFGEASVGAGERLSLEE